MRVRGLLKALMCCSTPAEAAPRGPIREHLMERVRWTVGPDGVGGADAAHLIAAARQWLNANRAALELNHKYPGFMDSGGPQFDRFGTAHAEYMLKHAQRGTETAPSP
jgi:hypothetical protein